MVGGGTLPPPSHQATALSGRLAVVALGTNGMRRPQPELAGCTA